MSGLTPGEKAYLESGGQDSAALLEENKAPAVEPVAQETAAAAEQAPEPAAAPPAPVAAADPVEPGEEEIPAQDGKTKRRVVDSRALKEERKKRQEIEAELNRFRENYSRVDERLKMLSEAVSQPEPTQPQEEQPEALIDPEQDIFGAYKQQQKRMDKLVQTLESLQAGQSEMRQQTEEERQTGAMIASYRQDAAAFTQQTPDFTDAYNYLLQKRGEQLKALGYNDAEVRSTLYNEEMSLAQRALGLRQSPSAHIYALASSMGYAKKAAPSPVAQAAPPAAPVPVPSVTAEIDRIKAGQNSSKSLSSGGGAAGEELSLELLANMSEKEFAAFMAKPGNRERVEQALGRRAA